MLVPVRADVVYGSSYASEEMASGGVRCPTDLGLFLSTWEALAGLTDCMSQEVSFDFLIPKSEPEKGASLALMAQLGALAEMPGHRVPAACPPLLAIPAEAGSENARRVLPRKTAVWRIHFQEVRCNCG